MAARPLALEEREDKETHEVWSVWKQLRHNIWRFQKMWFVCYDDEETLR
jgi:hypothetical protein